MHVCAYRRKSHIYDVRTKVCTDIFPIYVCMHVCVYRRTSYIYDVRTKVCTDVCRMYVSMRVFMYRGIYVRKYITYFAIEGHSEEGDREK